MDINCGDIIGKVLREQGVKFLFTLCGGHISPILVGAKKEGIRIVDVRDEVNAVFAADAIGRLTNTPGVAAVTAGPGVTNSITALKNAQLAQSPMVLLGGAAPIVMKNKGALQDIDQIALLDSIVKLAVSVRRNCDIISVLEHAFDVCRSGAPGPVFVECPVDLLYHESSVRQWYGVDTASQRESGLRSKLLDFYLKRHVDKMFACDFEDLQPGKAKTMLPDLAAGMVSKAIEMVATSQKPLLIVGSQAMLNADQIDKLAAAVDSMGMPVYLAGMARGLMGKSHPLQMRHQRKKALKNSDLVILAGMPCDFRLGYGRSFGSDTKVISINRSKADLRLNCRPDLAVHSDPFLFLCAMADIIDTISSGWQTWIKKLCERDKERENFILGKSAESTEFINPLHLLKKLNEVLDDNSIIVADGGDFVASAAYILQPRRPLSWLDPGVFGTLGVGAGFALASKLINPEAEVWLIYGDGAAGFSLQEFDSFARHKAPVIAVIGNDGGWSQIARDQVAMLGDDVATVLERSNYHLVAEAYGGKGFILKRPEDIDGILGAAKQVAREGKPVLINTLIGQTDFRKGSISM